MALGGSLTRPDLPSETMTKVRISGRAKRQYLADKPLDEA
jgi:hypothetical protein